MSVSTSFIIVWSARIAAVVASAAGTSELVYPWQHPIWQDMRALFLILAAMVIAALGEIVAVQIVLVTTARVTSGTPMTAKDVRLVFVPFTFAANALRAIFKATIGLFRGPRDGK